MDMQQTTTTRRAPLALPATIASSAAAGERVTVSLQVLDDDTLAGEVKVERGARVETVLFDPKHLIRWRKELDGQRLIDRAWRFGLRLDPGDPEPKNPRPRPGVLSESWSQDSGERLTVAIVDGEAEGERLVEVERVDAEGRTRAVRFAGGHLNAWRNSIKRAALLAWRTGRVGDEFINHAPS